ncbi:hypothetical protein GOP47_0005478 [Adiantum capillus-veneris]|uniref:Pentatricopeptide repeat-containing protein n=1 Tax=Adiantum capillus-veneris TaxID=13818 RepID=A0A9D4V5M1_ADICA|nr:hypothetical protein GOP47_0005478 [Adiantum capillus-veneris]
MALALPSTEALKHILLTCKKQKDITHAHAYMLNLGLDPYTVMENCIPSSLIQLGSLAQNGHQVWNRSMLPDANLCGSIIVSHVNAGEPQHALTLYQCMLRSGSVCPDGRTFVALLNSCAKLKHLEEGMGLHSHVDKLGLLRTDIFIGSALVDMFCRKWT